MQLIGCAAREDARASADLIACFRDVGRELPEAADGALEVRNERAHRRGHARRLRFVDDLSRAEGQVAARYAMEKLDDSFASREHAAQPQLKQADASAAGDYRRHDDFPPEASRHFGDEPQDRTEDDQAGENEEPHLLHLAEASNSHPISNIHDVVMETLNSSRLRLDARSE